MINTKKPGFVFFVGQLPPPVHGFSVINKAMFDAINNSRIKSIVYDVTPRNFMAPISKWVHYVFCLFRTCNQLRCLYLPFSGGIRQLLDFAFAYPAHLLGMPIYLHHHSFAYLNKKPWFSRFNI